jgi:hypothetical protein
MYINVSCGLTKERTSIKGKIQGESSDLIRGVVVKAMKTRSLRPKPEF